MVFESIGRYVVCGSMYILQILLILYIFIFFACVYIYLIIPARLIGNWSLVHYIESI